MIPRWVRSLCGFGAAVSDDGIESKLRALQNMKRMNDMVLSGQLGAAQLNELEIGAETLTLNLKKGDTDRLKNGGGK